MDALGPNRTLLVAAAMLTLLIGHAAADTADDETRKAYCAGSWYPGEARVLNQQLDDLLSGAEAPTISSKPLAIIAPHAGYRYSAAVAAPAYRSLRGHTYERVVALAFSHRYAGSYQGVDVPAELTAYNTPLGEVPIDRKACQQLLADALFGSNPGVDRHEHSLELQLPFLQKVLGDFQLVPLYVGRLSAADYTQAAKGIIALLDDKTLLVVSSDFTHFGPNYGYQPFDGDVKAKLKDLAAQAAAPILKCDFDGFLYHLLQTEDTICGREPIKLLLRILSMQGSADGMRSGFDTSGNLTRDWTNSVTYQSFVFTKRQTTLAAGDRQRALQLARNTITAHFRQEQPPAVDAATLPAGLRADGACFVTLQNRGQLRGCIGNMMADGPLYAAVVRNALSACQDQRFVGNPVTAEELDHLTIEISYLTPMQPASNLHDIVVGRHGLCVSRGRHRGVLLPQVAYDRGWTRADFLAQVCRKAGLSPGAWQLPQTDLYLFEAEVFGEAE